MVRSCPQLSSLAVGIHSPVDGRLGRFQGLAIMNKAVMNILVRGFCGPMFSFLLEKHLRVEMLGHRVHVCLTFVCFFFKILFIQFQREGKGGRKRERNINVWLPLACPLLGTWPTTQACALTGDRTCYPLVCRPTLNTLSHTSQD